MPKVVDHDARRRELAGAVWRVITRDGIEGVSIRDVAAESGWSTGALRHYFKTKEELIVYAAQLVVERVTERLQGIGAAGTFRDAVRAALLELLPLDPDRRTEAAIWLAFVVRSLTDPGLEDDQQIGFQALDDLCRALLRAAAEAGQLAPGLDSDEEATRLHALLDGWALHGLMRWLDPPALTAAVDAYLDTIFGDSTGAPAR